MHYITALLMDVFHLPWQWLARVSNQGRFDDPGRGYRFPLVAPKHELEHSLPLMSTADSAIMTVRVKKELHFQC